MLAHQRQNAIHELVRQRHGLGLAREGLRVLHAGDTTGAAIQDALSALVRHSPVIEIYEERFLVDLLTMDDRCIGALVCTRPRFSLGANASRSTWRTRRTGGGSS